MSNNLTSPHLSLRPATRDTFAVLANGRALAVLPLADALALCAQLRTPTSAPTRVVPSPRTAPLRDAA